MSDIVERLQAANPNVSIRSVNHPAFARYGRVLDRFDASEMIARAKEILPGSEEIVYEPSVPALEEPSALNTAIATQVYGGMDVQVGWCYGRNLQMAGLEYHKGIEVNVCLTETLLLVGDQRDIAYADEPTYDTRLVEGFYAPAGCVVEFHPWNLHFAPIHVAEGGSFATLVYLPRRTNTDIAFEVERVGEAKLLFAVNKWLLVHPDAADLIGQGAYPGLVGDDIFVTPV
jgi:hypothetical protein